MSDLTPVQTKADLVETEISVQGSLVDVCNWIGVTVRRIVAEHGHARVMDLFIRPGVRGEDVYAATIVYLAAT